MATSQIANIAAKHRCDCYSSATTSFLYGLRREGPPTERTTLERLLNILSRAAISDSKNPQRIWSQQPDWWHLCTPLPWKNPREHPKDRKDVLKKKVEILQGQLQLRGMLTKELEEEWLLYKSSTKTDLERKSDFEAIIAKSSGLHHMLDRVRDKVKSACLLSDKVAEYICQLKVCLEKSLREVSAMHCLVEEKERGKKKLWDQMGVCQPAKRLKMVNGGNLTILSPDDHVDDVPELSPILLMSNMDSDPLPSPSTEHESIDYPSLENLAESKVEHGLNCEVTLNSASYMDDINKTGKRRLGHVRSGDEESLISAQEVSCEEIESIAASMIKTTHRGYSSGSTAAKEMKELKLALSREKITESSKCKSSDIIITSPELLLTSLNVSVTSPDVSNEISNIHIASPTVESLSVPTASSEVSVTSHGTSPNVSVTSSDMLRMKVPSWPGLSARDTRFTTSNHVRRKSESGLDKIRSPPFPRHLSQMLPQTTKLPNFLDIPITSYNTFPDVRHAAKRSSTQTVTNTQRRTRAPPTASTRATDRETELAVSAILVPEVDQEEIIVADEDILNEVEEIIEESPAPTVRMYVETVDNNDDDLQKNVTDSYGQVEYEDILPSVEGVIMAGLSEGVSEATTGLEDCKIPQVLLPVSSYSVSQRLFSATPNSLSLDIGREVIP